MVERSSSIVDWNDSTERTVRAASGCLPIKSNSPAMGLKRVAKWFENPTPEVNRAVRAYNYERYSRVDMRRGAYR